MTELIRKHFNYKAKKYLKSKKNFMWRALRNYELKQIERLLPDSQIETILELGVGSGSYTSLLNRKYSAEITGVDFSKQMILNNTQNYKALHNENLSEYKQLSHFDLVTAFGVFEFLKEPTVQIINRITKVTENSELIIISPEKNFFGYIYKFLHPLSSSINLFSRGEIIKESREKGLKCTATGIFPFNTLLRIRR
jgi:trans-aconitate methyltransferase